MGIAWVRGCDSESEKACVGGRLKGSKGCEIDCLGVVKDGDEIRPFPVLGTSEPLKYKFSRATDDYKQKPVADEFQGDYTGQNDFWHTAGWLLLRLCSDRVRGAPQLEGY